MGDLNSDITPGLESNESHFGRRFRRILCSYGLKDIINSPTRIISDSKSLIDLIVTSQPAKVQTSGSTDLGISDHHFIFSVFEGARSNPKPLVISTKKYKKMEKSNLTKILSMFLGILWVCLMIVTSSGTTTYNDIIDHHLPSRKAKIRSKSLPWTDSSIRKGMNDRFKLLNEAKASGDPVKWSQYRKKKMRLKKSVKEGRSGLLEWSI